MDAFLNLIDQNVLIPLVWAVLFLIILKKIVPGRYKIASALEIIRWIIIGYAAVALCYFLFGIMTNPDSYAIVNRAKGPYRLLYFLMTFCSLILPFSLLIKKLAAKPFYILIVALLIRIGWYLERFVIFVSSLHRDYAPSLFHSEYPSLMFIVSQLLKGAALTILILIFAHYFSKNQKSSLQNS
ncbi:MAG: hypothetical protein ABJM06_11310 [Gilvibacter sp.]